jgi:hypothetical protein
VRKRFVVELQERRRVGHDKFIVRADSFPSLCNWLLAARLNDRTSVR